MSVLERGVCIREMPVLENVCISDVSVLERDVSMRQMFASERGVCIRDCNFLRVYNFVRYPLLYHRLDLHNHNPLRVVARTPCKHHELVCTRS